jgi:hypothetical protein
MYRENAPGPEGLTCPLSNAAGYLADADRFHSDVSGEEMQLRQQRYHRSQQIYDNKRLQYAEKEEQRWQKIEEVKAAEESYWEKQRDLGLKVPPPPSSPLFVHLHVLPSSFPTQAKKNSSGVPYNTVTLQYNDGKDGERLRESDDLVRYRAALRAKNLVVRN